MKCPGDAEEMPAKAPATSRFRLLGRLVSVVERGVGEGGRFRSFEMMKAAPTLPS